AALAAATASVVRSTPRAAGPDHDAPSADRPRAQETTP
ncbi:DNA repair protein RecO, partial [Clavibacter lycopersici]